MRSFGHDHNLHEAAGRSAVMCNGSGRRYSVLGTATIVGLWTVFCVLCVMNARPYMVDWNTGEMLYAFRGMWLTRASVLVFLWVAVLGLLVWRQDTAQMPLRFLMAMILAAGYMIVRISWSPAPDLNQVLQLVSLWVMPPIAFYVGKRTHSPSSIRVAAWMSCGLALVLLVNSWRLGGAGSIGDYRGITDPLVLSSFVVWMSLLEKRDKLVSVVGYAALIYLIVQSGLRSGLLSAALFPVALLWFRGRRRLASAVALSAVICLVVASLIMTGLEGNSALGRIAQLLRSPSADLSLSYRLAFWRTSVQLWKTNPLFGLGWHGFASAGTTVGATTAALFSAHNLVLDILVDGGIVGTILMVALYAELFRLLRKQPILLAGLFSMGIMALVGSAPAIYPYQFAKMPEVIGFWFVMGLFYKNTVCEPIGTLQPAKSPHDLSSTSPREQH